MNGSNLANKIISEYQTGNVLELARKLNISIVYGKWFPVTLGEFCLKTRQITINQNAKIPFEKIIAHELGHYFAGEFNVQKSDEFFIDFNEEKFCDEFAEELLKCRK